MNELEDIREDMDVEVEALRKRTASESQTEDKEPLSNG